MLSSYLYVNPICSMYGIYANIGVIYGVNVGVHIPAPWFASGNINVIYILSEYLEILRGRKTT